MICMRKLTYLFIGVIFLINSYSYSQNIQAEEKKLFTDSLGNIFVNTQLDFYIFLSEEDKAEDKLLLESNSLENSINFSQHGSHTLVHKEPGTKNSISYEIFADGIAPVTSVDFSEGLVMRYENRHYCDSLSVLSFNTQDKHSGISHTYYSINNKEYIKWNKQPLRLHDEMDLILKFYSVDNVGNLESEKSIRIIYDTESIISLEKIYFELNSANLNEKSIEQLDELAKSLKEFPELRIVLMSHTDARGTSSYNLRLSKMRAESVKSYLVSKGISPSRLEAKGYGDTMILNECKRGVECTEEEHKINRRTEFKILPFKHQ